MVDGSGYTKQTLYIKKCLELIFHCHNKTIKNLMVKSSQKTLSLKKKTNNSLGLEHWNKTEKRMDNKTIRKIK